MSVNAGANLYASGNNPGIIRTNSNDPYATNSVLSGKVNTNVGGVVVNPPSVINKTGVTTVPYNASGVYSPGVASTGYVAAVPNRGTQEVRQTVTTTAPNYAYEQQMRMTRGQNSGNYEVRTVETRPTPAYTNTTSYQAPVTTNTNYHTPMVASGIHAAPVVASRGPAPATVQTRYTEQNATPTYVHREEKPSWWFKPLLALIGLLALAGIILGLLFGLGVIGGNKNVFDRGTDSTTAQGTTIDGVNYSNYTITQQTTVLNNSGSSTTTTSTTPASTSTTTTTTTPASTSTSTSSSSTSFTSPTVIAPTVTTPTTSTTTTVSTTSTTAPATVATSGNVRRSTTVTSSTATQPIVVPATVVSPVAA